MPFELAWTKRAQEAYDRIKANAVQSKKGKKSSKQQGLFNQVVKCLRKLAADPRQSGLNSHEFFSMENPYHPDGKVFECYVQNQTPGAYRVFWCYGPEKDKITVLAITPHP